MLSAFGLRVRAGYVPVHASECEGSVAAVCSSCQWCSLSVVCQSVLSLDLLEAITGVTDAFYFMSCASPNAFCAYLVTLKTALHCADV